MDENFFNDLDSVMEMLTDILEDKKLSPETSAAYRDDVRRFLLWWGGRGYPIYGGRKMGREDVVAYLNGLKQTLLPEELNRILAALRIFCSFRYGSWDPKKSPTWKIPNFWDDVKAYSWLDAQQQNQLEAAIDLQLQTPLEAGSWQTRWTRAATLVRLLLHTGLHGVEAQALRLEDVRLGNTLGMIHVRGKRDRNVQLDPLACIALRAWLAIRPQGGQDWLWFEIDRGTAHPIGHRAVLRACWRMSQLAGLGSKTITPRVLRNTCTHNLLAAGMPPDQVKRLLRYQSIDNVFLYK